MPFKLNDNVFVDSRRASLAQRMKEAGATNVVPADYLYRSCFHRQYQGTGNARDIGGSEVATSFLEYAESLALPLNRSGELSNVLQAEKEAKSLVKSFQLTKSKGPVQLYTSETQLRVLDYGALKFYKAMNHSLARDDAEQMQALAPFIKKLNFYLNETRHDGGVVYSGVSLGRSSRDLLAKGGNVRIPRFLSTSSLRDVARDHCPDLSKDILGVLLAITIDRNFWGARDITAESEFEDESETLLPPYSQFTVISTNWRTTPPEVRLCLIDKYAEDSARMPLVVQPKAKPKAKAKPKPHFEVGDTVEITKSIKCRCAEHHQTISRGLVGEINTIDSEGDAWVIFHRSSKHWIGRGDFKYLAISH